MESAFYPGPKPGQHIEHERAVFTAGYTGSHPVTTLEHPAAVNGFQHTLLAIVERGHPRIILQNQRDANLEASSRFPRTKIYKTMKCEIGFL